MSAATLIYDGECPFCSRYARYVRLRRALGDLRLIDARRGGPEIDWVRDKGLDINAGMVLRIGGEFYHGAACLNRLALMSSRSDTFNSVNVFLFKHPQLARFAYPLLRMGRNATLKVLGRPPLSA